MSSCTAIPLAPARTRPTFRLAVGRRQPEPASPVAYLAAAAFRRPTAAFAAVAATLLSLLAIATVLRGSPLWLVHNADARMWHPGDGFDLSAGRALVEGLEVAAAALGLVGKLRLATVTAGLCGLVLCLLHA